MQIYCCNCEKDVEAAQITGEQAYPHLPSLFVKKFWQCPHCHNFVGAHEKGPLAGHPFGVIATPELKRLRQQIHNLIDPLWKIMRIDRKVIYKKMSKAMGKEYHTGEIRTIEEAEQALMHARKINTYYIYGKGPKK